MIEIDNEFTCGTGISVPPNIANRKNTIKMMAITSPSGETGHWLFDEFTVGSSVENAINIVSRYINESTTGFKIRITKCSDVVPSEISLKDDSLRCIDIPIAVMRCDNGMLVSKNRDIFTRMVAEASINTHYRDWFYARIDALIEDDDVTPYITLKDDFNKAIDALS